MIEDMTEEEFNRMGEEATTALLSCLSNMVERLAEDEDGEINHESISPLTEFLDRWDSPMALPLATGIVFSMVHQILQYLPSTTIKDPVDDGTIMTGLWMVAEVAGFTNTGITDDDVQEFLQGGLRAGKNLWEFIMWVIMNGEPAIAAEFMVVMMLTIATTTLERGDEILQAALSHNGRWN